MNQRTLDFVHALIVVLLLILSFAQIGLQISIRSAFDGLSGFGMLWPPPGGIQDLYAVPENILSGPSTALIVSAATVLTVVGLAIACCISHWTPVSEYAMLSRLSDF